MHTTTNNYIIIWHANIKKIINSFNPKSMDPCVDSVLIELHWPKRPINSMDFVLLVMFSFVRIWTTIDILIFGLCIYVWRDIFKPTDSMSIYIRNIMIYLLFELWNPLLNGLIIKFRLLIVFFSIFKCEDKEVARDKAETKWWIKCILYSTLLNILEFFFFRNKFKHRIKSCFQENSWYDIQNPL